MSVDLGRLREAVNAKVMRPSWAFDAGKRGVADELVCVLETAQAVLNSPTVWWCVEYLTADTPGCHTSEFHGCGWRVLVPVTMTGITDATIPVDTSQSREHRLNREVSE